MDFAKELDKEIKRIAGSKDEIRMYVDTVLNPENPVNNLLDRLKYERYALPNLNLSLGLIPEGIRVGYSAYMVRLKNTCIVKIRNKDYIKMQIVPVPCSISGNEIQAKRLEDSIGKIISKKDFTIDVYEEINQDRTFDFVKDTNIINQIDAKLNFIKESAN